VPTDDQFHEKLKDDIGREIRDRIQQKMDRKMARFEEKMARKRIHRSGSSGAVLGSIIVLVGLGLLLDNLGIVRFHDVWRYWPVFLIVYGISRILSGQSISSYVWGGVVALIGAFVLLDNLDIVQFNFDFIWPLLIIGFGLSILVRTLDRKRYLDGVPVSSEPVLNIVTVFSGTRRVIDNPDFRGGEITAVFGGVRLDLTRAKITVDRAVIEINAVFGGVEVRVPETWSVTTKGAGVFGGFDDKTLHPKPDPNVKIPELIITGAAVFGGLSVSN
jgi:predicted membrane protein